MELKETHKRSMTKSIIWRILGVGVLALITYLFTRSLITTGLITALHHGVFLIVYYLHERLWQRIGDRVTGKKRRILRAFLYEIIFGNGILFLICILVGDITGFINKFVVSFGITFTYIQNKLWIYVVYDKIWDRIKWESQ